MTIYLAVDDALLEAISPLEEPSDEERAEIESAAKGGSRTFDLLLDVEMPVSVSFGRASVPLKEVLNLRPDRSWS